MGTSRIERQPKEMPLWSVIFPSFTQQEWSVSWLGCDLRWKVGSLQQPAALSSVVRRRRSSTLPEARVAPKEGHADCLVVSDWSHPLQFFECRWNHYGEVLSTNRWNASETSTTTPSISQEKGQILLHDNAWPHVAKPTLQKLNKLGYETLPHLPYSPDLSPTDYHFFKHLDNFLHEKCFKNLSDIKNAFSDFIATRNGINTLVLRWQKSVDSDGTYFDQ